VQHRPNLQLCLHQIGRTGIQVVTGSRGKDEDTSFTALVSRHALQTQVRETQKEAKDKEITRETEINTKKRRQTRRRSPFFCDVTPYHRVIITAMS
jgi:hypothetical protein